MMLPLLRLFVLQALCVCNVGAARTDMVDKLAEVSSHEWYPVQHCIAKKGDPSHPKFRDHCFQAFGLGITIRDTCLLLNADLVDGSCPSEYTCSWTEHAGAISSLSGKVFYGTQYSKPEADDGCRMPNKLVDANWLGHKLTLALGSRAEWKSCCDASMLAEKEAGTCLCDCDKYSEADCATLLTTVASTNSSSTITTSATATTTTTTPTTTEWEPPKDGLEAVPEELVAEKIKEANAIVEEEITVHGRTSNTSDNSYFSDKKFRINCIWDGNVDFDLHLELPSDGEQQVVYWNAQAVGDFTLDVDDHGNTFKRHIESISKKRGAELPNGRYTAYVRYFDGAKTRIKIMATLSVPGGGSNNRVVEGIFDQLAIGDMVKLFEFDHQDGTYTFE